MGDGSGRARSSSTCVTGNGGISRTGREEVRRKYFASDESCRNCRGWLMSESMFGAINPPSVRSIRSEAEEGGACATRCCPCGKRRLIVSTSPGRRGNLMLQSKVERATHWQAFNAANFGDYN